MQTMILDHKTSAKGMRHILADRAPALPPVAKPQRPSVDTTISAGASTQMSAHAELDAMLSRDPNFGAVQGLRVALLFNAGLALSGLIAWEIWSLLAH